MHFNFWSILSDFINYFENTFINIKGECKLLHLSRYDHEFWSVVENVSLFLPRTNCSVEAWNRSFNQSIYAPHPNIAKFVEEIKKESEWLRVNLLQAKQGIIPVRTRNFKKEMFLIDVVNNYYLYEGLSYFFALNSVYCFKFD